MARNFASGNYLQAPSNDRFDGERGATWAFWIKYTSTTANLMPMSRLTSGSRQGAGITINNGGTGNMQAFFYDTTTQRLALAATGLSLNNGNWRHIAFAWDRTLDANAQKLYVDGALVAQGTASGSWIMGQNVVRMGKAIDGFWGNLVGDMADIAIWSAKLTADEIARLAGRMSPGHIRPRSLELFVPCLD